MKQVSDGHGGTRDAATVPGIIAGTVVSSNLAKARKFYEEFLGLECVRCAPDRLIVRDKVAADFMQRGERGGFVIDVREVDEVSHPQGLLNHWGIAVPSIEEVDRIRQIALEEGDKYGIIKVNPITKMHGTYQFYFIDLDNNWWEIEFRNPNLTHEGILEKGDFNKQ